MITHKEYAVGIEINGEHVGFLRRSPDSFNDEIAEDAQAFDSVPDVLIDRAIAQLHAFAVPTAQAVIYERTVTITRNNWSKAVFNTTVNP